MDPRLDSVTNLLQTFLDVQTRRSHVIASNIANADTPGYKAVDIDFREVLRGFQSQAATEAYPDQSTKRAPVPESNAAPIQYRAAVQPSIDGNTVDLDLERANFADAAIRYEFSLARAVGRYKELAKMLDDIR